MPIIDIESFAARKFDYVVLGGGTAGLALAARLAQSQNTTVGVIEAGGYHIDIPEIDVPGFMGRNIARPDYDWTFFSAPQVHAGGRQIIEPRGKGLGGSSLLNFMGLVRPSKQELDALEELGNEGWNWASMLEYMKKSETYQPSNLSPEDAKKYAVSPKSEYHGSSGPIKKSYPVTWTEPQALLFDAFEALGVPRNGEMGDGSNIGATSSFTSIDVRTSKRSSATEYYESMDSTAQPNLHILLNTQVCKIIFEKTADGDQRATGVEVAHAGNKRTLNNIADEIVLSAGTYQTPQLLELSGIGNPKILEKHGITPLINLPGVGENLQDHVCVPTTVEIDPEHLTVDVLLDPAELKHHEELYKQHCGLLTSVPAPSFIFLSSKDLGRSEGLHWWQSTADVTAATHMEATESPTIRSGFQKQYNLQKSWFQQAHLAQAEVLQYIGYQQPILAEPGKRYTTLVNALMHPLSRGTVHIASADPLAPPNIDPKYLSNEADMELLLHVFLHSMKVLETSPMSNIVRGFQVPSASVMEKNEGLADRLREYIRNSCRSVFHPVGTAAMLPLSDGGVVDSKLKVYGTSNLRVVDLSILPMEMACHTQSMAYAIAEKAADILRK